MAVPIALAAISLLAAAVSAGLIVVVSVAVRKEDRNLTLTGQATGNLTRMGRRLTGVHVLRPARQHFSRPADDADLPVRAGPAPLRAGPARYRSRYAADAAGRSPVRNTRRPG
jgi:hypothetical protein